AITLVTAMNSPTIAAVVPGPAPQAGPASSAEAATDESPRFADVLAGHAPSAKDADRADASSEAKPSGDADRPVEQGAESAKAGDASEKDVAKTEPDPADDVLAALPQIALEIASHARDQAAGRSHAPVRGENIPATAGAQVAEARSAVARRQGANAPEQISDALHAERSAKPQESKEPGLQAQAANAASAMQASAAFALAGPGNGRATPAELAT